MLRTPQMNFWELGYKYLMKKQEKLSQRVKKSAAAISGSCIL